MLTDVKPCATIIKDIMTETETVIKTFKVLVNKEALMKTAFVFPGQGSQKVGMLQDLYNAYPISETTF